MSLRAVFTCLCLFVLTACGVERSEQPPIPADFVTVADDLEQIRADFNATQERVRLVFIIGPSCGICLRGMDDLHESIVKRVQDDPRIHTFAIHVPALGAKEEHVAAAIPLLYGPRVTHYWDPSGNTGLEYQKTLDIPMYAWDLWFVYEPGATWEADQPPPYPDYWEHQLQGLPSDRRLDAERFAKEVTVRLTSLPTVSEDSSIFEPQQRDPGLIAVAQGRGYVIRQNHSSRGGYQVLKRIASIDYEGTTEVGSKKYRLALKTRRPNHYERKVSDASIESVTTWDGSAAQREGALPGLPIAFQDEFLLSYEFDGWMTDWKDKGHEVRRLGMKKVGKRLPWLMEAELANGRTWHVSVDSHTGDAFRSTLVESPGGEAIRIEYSDYREADGFRLPHRIQYFYGDRLLATDRFTRISVELAASTATDASRLSASDTS